MQQQYGDLATVRTLLQWLFPRGRLTLKVILLWLLVVALFAASGFIDWHAPRGVRNAAEGAMLQGGLGVGIATCVTVGLLITAKVQGNRLPKRAAIFHLVTSSFVSTVSTLVLILLVRPFFPKSWDILHGEEILGLFTVTACMGIAAIAIFVLFTIAVLLSRQQPEQGFYQLHGKMIRFRGMEWGNPLAGWFVVSVPD